MKKINLLSVIILFLISVKVYAQVPYCGLDGNPEYYPSKEVIDQIDEIIKTNNNLRRDGHGTFNIRIYLHVSRRSDGTGAVSEESIVGSLELLEDIFGPEGIFFVQGAPIDYIDNDERYNSVYKNDVFYTNSHEDGIDIYYHPIIAGVRGTAEAIGSLAFIVTNEYSSTHTFTHEMGHCLGLYHTHSTFHGAELVDGSNATTAGDKIVDTPADPDLFWRTAMRTCTYIGIVRDANGDLYNPSMTNIMSYTANNCREDLTPGQFDYCRATLLSNPTLSSAIIEYNGISYTYIEDSIFHDI